jgi:predicted nucleotidyltransferase
MSGNFVQRGEAAIFEKHLRAKHAVLAGADAVIELPVLFSTSNAELFAKGAVKILSSIPEISHLCFGAENASVETFLTAARLMNNEPEDVSSAIKELTAQGESYAKARAKAYKRYLPKDFLRSPNNTLGVEYTRALLALHSKIEILPIPRIGCGYTDEKTQENFSSATALRSAFEKSNYSALKSNLPTFVYNDLAQAKLIDLSSFEKLALLITSKSDVANVCDCTEGLENAFKKIAKTNTEDFVQELTSARYTSSRIKRIALQNLLTIKEAEIRKALSSSLYIRLLATKRENSKILSALGCSSFPLLVKNSDMQKLTSVALSVFEKENQADSIYALARNEQFISYSPFI